MKAVVQRVRRTALYVDGKLISEINFGLAVFLGVKMGDEKSKVEFLAKKIANLRIFRDAEDKMNLSVKDVGGQILLVSQFTLLGDTSHGNRPSFSNAEKPERAFELYEYMAEKLREQGLEVKCGVFGAHMEIEQYNDGPVTITYEI